MSYRILKITSFYKPFLKYFYEKHPLAKGLTYQKHFDLMMHESHGWSNFFQHHFTNMGNEAFELVHNASLLQQAWANENNIEYNDELVFNQIKKIQPDVLFFQDSISFNHAFFTRVREQVPGIKLMLGHCCSPFSRENLEAFSKLDFMLSCSPGFGMIFDRHGIKNYPLLHGFETEILNRISPPTEKKNQVVFTGSFLKVSDSQFHDERLKLVERILSENIPFQLFATIETDSAFAMACKQAVYIATQGFKKAGLNTINNAIGVLKKTSMLHTMPRKSKYPAHFLKALHSPVYGLDMFQETANNAVSLNNHGGVAGDYAANMRMFEVTGVGSVLLTDHKQNISTIFEPDFEIVTYKNWDECMSKMKWLINNPNEANKIAIAGQKRIFKDHTIKNRVILVDEMIRQHLL